MADKLQFRRVTGQQVEAELRVDDVEFPAGEFLLARRIWLDDSTELRQHCVAKGARRSSGYDSLDNEILAGRRLYEVGEWGGYPPEVARLYGDEATSADPYALFEPYRGEPLSEVGTYLFHEEQEAFEVSLLTGLCWLAAAGIAHRALRPDTVLWDSRRRQAQITDFSLSTVFGAPREAIAGSPSWVARETRPGSVSSVVSERDDIWAAGRLIFFVRNQGEELTSRGQLAESGLGELLDGVFGPPEARPTARELLVDRMRRPDPVPPRAGSRAGLTEGHRHFWEARQRKHPGAVIPKEAAQDACLPPDPRQAGPPPGPDADPATQADGLSRKPRDRGLRWRRGGG
jgi:serine/threonine protein kinase